MARKKLKCSTNQRPFSIIYHDFYKCTLLNMYEKMVFIALKVFSDENNQCFPSAKKLSNVTGISIRKIQNILKQLEQKNIIEIENRLRIDGGSTSNLYTLHDFKELWSIDNDEEKITAINNYKEIVLVKELQSRGYIVTKEKAPETLQADQSNNESSTENNQYSKTDNTAYMKKSQDLERYTIDQIKQLFDYDIMLQKHPDQQPDINAVMNVLHTAMNTGKLTIRISGEDKPAMIVIGKLMKLDKESIMYAIDKFSEQAKRIKNPTAYLLTILYNAPEQYYLDKKNQERNEIAKEDHSQEEKKADGKNKDSKNTFANFKQRTYDYEELERNLLNQAQRRVVDQPENVS